MISKGCFPYRPHDYMYDPIFTVSGPVDHYKAAIVAKMSSVKFQVCPIFQNMFSDLPNHPRLQLVERRQRPMFSYEEKLEGSTFSRKNGAVDVGGKDRAKFFCPTINLPPADFVGPYDQMPKFTIEKVKKHEGKENIGEDGTVVTKDIQVQTMYRESEAQTIPWQPPYIVVDEGDPEILKLDYLKWGSGLPVGVHEIKLIERARMKRAWEAKVKPDINDEQSLLRFRDYVEALERDEWAFREREIQEIQDLRLHLLEKMLEEIHATSHDKVQKKLERIIRRTEREKQEKLKKIQNQTAREMRKLIMAEKGITRRYRQPDIIEEHINKSSELYGPMLRNGEHPKRWHQVIDEHMQRYKAQFIGVEKFSTLPRWLNRATFIKEVKPEHRAEGPHICIRESKWTQPVLKKLYEEMTSLRSRPECKTCWLRIKNRGPEIECVTPECYEIPYAEEEQYQSVLYIQKLLQGRATQMAVHEGRIKCNELIQELKFSMGLMKDQKENRTADKLQVLQQQREVTMHRNMYEKLRGVLARLQGTVVGSLFDFLNKELKRLLEERKAHAMCWINERERNIREAAEAGRRQKEIRRRREHDEMFKQIVKINEESIDVYLQDIVTEGMNFASKEEATEYVVNVADKMSEQLGVIDEICSVRRGLDPDDEEIAELVHHFVLPEVEKQSVRDKITARQRNKLQTIHESIYKRMDSLASGEIHSNPSSEPTIADATFSSNVLEFKTDTEKTDEHDALPPISTAPKFEREKASDQYLAPSGVKVENLFTVSDMEMDASTATESTEEDYAEFDFPFLGGIDYTAFDEGDEGLFSEGMEADWQDTEDGGAIGGAFKTSEEVVEESITDDEENERN